MFKIGEFAKIAKVSKRLLHHYDALGLLVPSYTDESTGYRYYAAEQLTRLNRIMVMKQLGLELQDIEQLLKREVSQQELQQLLLVKKAEVEQIIEDSQRRLRDIELRLQYCDEDVEVPDVVLKNMPAQPIISLKTVFTTEEDIMALLHQVLSVTTKRVTPHQLGTLMFVAYGDDVMVPGAEMELGFSVNKPLKNPIEIGSNLQLLPGELPAVEHMATCVQTGGPDPAFGALHHIAHWIEANHYQICGPYREWVFNAKSIADLLNCVFEIQMPIKPAKL